MEMTQFNLQEVENMVVQAIKNLPRTREQVKTHINPNNFWELQAFGVTINVYHATENGISGFNSCQCSNKILYHVQGGKKCVIQQSLR